MQGELFFKLTAPPMSLIVITTFISLVAANPICPYRRVASGPLEEGTQGDGDIAINTDRTSEKDQSIREVNQTCRHCS